MARRIAADRNAVLRAPLRAASLTGAFTAGAGAAAAAGAASATGAVFLSLARERAGGASVVIILGASANAAAMVGCCVVDAAPDSLAAENLAPGGGAILV